MERRKGWNSRENPPRELDTNSAKNQENWDEIHGNIKEIMYTEENDETGKENGRNMELAASRKKGQDRSG